MTADHLVPGRQCGGCKVCCIVSAIDGPDMQKQPGALCRHRLAGGCDIYESRPAPCRSYFCGWRQLAFLDDDWRPDRSGVLIENDNPALADSGAMILMLVGNPLKTVRQQRFLDFVGKNIEKNVVMFLGLPGPPGKAPAAVPLNTAEMRSAVSQSRSHVRLALEQVLRRLSGHEYVPYVMKHAGNDAGT